MPPRGLRVAVISAMYASCTVRRFRINLSFTITPDGARRRGSNPATLSAPMGTDAAIDIATRISGATTDIATRVTGAIRDAARVTGAGFEYLLNTALRESNLNPSAKAKSSSATGLFQFIDQTWLG